MLEKKTLCCLVLWLSIVLFLFIVLFMLVSRQNKSPRPLLPTGCEVITSGDESFAGRIGVGGSVFAEAGAGNIVNVYERSNGIWVHACSLVNSDANGGRDNFAVWSSSIGISSDGKTIVIGASAHSGYPSNHGAAYVFERPGTTWMNAGTVTETRRLLASDYGSVSTKDSSFGKSLDIDDGSIIVIGSLGHSNYQGMVYVYERPGSSWGGVGDLRETRQLIGSDTDSYHMFGNSVSLQGTTIAVSKRGYVRYGIKGCGYVFEKPGPTWAGPGQLLENRILKFSATDTTGRVVFTQIIIDGNDIAVNEIEHNNYTGQILMFERDGPTWGTGTEAPLIESRILFPSGAQAIGGMFAFKHGVFILLNESLHTANMSVFQKPGDTWAGEGILAESYAIGVPPSITDNVSGRGIWYDGTTLVVSYGKRVVGDEDDEPGYHSTKYIQVCTR